MCVDLLNRGANAGEVSAHLGDITAIFVLASKLLYLVARRSEAMRSACRCGKPVSSPEGEQSCVKCGTACCPACAFSLDAATYCARCAESILDAEGIPLALSTQAGPPPRRDRARDAPAPLPSLGGDGAPWVILVARDQVDLYAHLVRAFSRDDKVQVLMDRRRDSSRNPPGTEERLRIHGAAVIRRGGGR
jgi:hypothetical protein